MRYFIVWLVFRILKIALLTLKLYHINVGLRFTEVPIKNSVEIKNRNIYIFEIIQNESINIAQIVMSPLVVT